MAPHSGGSPTVKGDSILGGLLLRGNLALVGKPLCGKSPTLRGGSALVEGLRSGGTSAFMGEPHSGDGCPALRGLFVLEEEPYSRKIDPL